MTADLVTCNTEILKSLVSQVFETSIKKQYWVLTLCKVSQLLGQAAKYLDKTETLGQEKLLESSYMNYAAGCFYIYLLVPNANQFQLEDTEYGTYLQLKNNYLVKGEGDLTFQYLLDRVREKCRASQTLEMNKNRNSGNFSVKLSQKANSCCDLSTMEDKSQNTSTDSSGSSLECSDSKSALAKSPIDIDHDSKQYTLPIIINAITEEQKLSVFGIRNLGNTCYMNSMLQCLFGSTQFRDLFLTDKFEMFKAETNSESLSIANDLSLLFKKMYQNGGCAIIPKSFMETCKRLRPDFKIPHCQQDTQEFLMFVLERLRVELANTSATVKDRSLIASRSNNRYLKKNKNYLRWYNEMISRNNLSPIDLLFRGDVESKLICKHCNESASTFSSFYILSLNIPKEKSSLFFKSKTIRLEDCINLFTRKEILTGENSWACPSCETKARYNVIDNDKTYQQKHTNIGKHSKFPRFFSHIEAGKTERNSGANKFSQLKYDNLENEQRHRQQKKSETILSVSFVSLPPILVIHLSRFCYDISKKNTSNISYPMSLTVETLDNSSVTYRLYGTINHIGSPRGGHYTALVNKEKNHFTDLELQKWVEFDDDLVFNRTDFFKSKNEINSITNNDAYVLFYERI